VPCRLHRDFLFRCFFKVDRFLFLEIMGNIISYGELARISQVLGARPVCSLQIEKSKLKFDDHVADETPHPVFQIDYIIIIN
jgi:hypothetical protein